MVKMAERCQSSWVVQEWKQVALVRKWGRSLVAVVSGRWGRSVLDGIWVWRGRARETRQLVAGEASRLYQYEDHDV